MTSTKKEYDLQDALEKCSDLFFSEDFEGLLVVSDEILENVPDNPNAIGYKGIALCFLENCPEAFRILERGIELYPDNYYLKNNMAMVLYDLGKYEASLKLCEEGLKIKKFDWLCENKIKALMKLKRFDEAFEFLKSLGDNFFTFDDTISIINEFIDSGEYEKALECLDKLNETNWLYNYSIIDGYKRIANHSDLDLSERYDKQYYMEWIAMIKSKSDENTCPLCGGKISGNFSLCDKCSEEINMSPQGTLIECGSLQMYYYICDKLKTLKNCLKPANSTEKLHKKMDYLDDAEFNAFINHLKDIEYIVEPSKDFIFDGDLMQTHCEEGKYAAPRWLAFPGYSAWTMGWRMGDGEDYAMNQPYQGELFEDLFPEPKNWLFNPRDPAFESLPKFPFLGAVWDKDINPKYSQITSDAIEVNDFITLEQEGKFRNDGHWFNSIEHAILFSKIVSYNRDCDPYNVTLDELKNDYGITDEQLAEWEVFKYTVCLNATYYKFMGDEKLRKRLLATGDKCLIYKSNDEWGGDENLFGFALMQVRDELQRLWEHEILIDWKYTEYLKNAYPYLNHERDPNDKQSAEYRVAETIFTQSSRYVRDVNLNPEIAGKYEAGQILTEKGFVDASDKIGGMKTTHRYLILSGYMADLSQFESETNWGIHTANRNSRFKVLDIFEVGDKTQILLLHLPDAFESVFENKTDVEEEFIERERENFLEDLKKDVVSDLDDGIWIERCRFPIGMSDEGEFY